MNFQECIFQDIFQNSKDVFDLLIVIDIVNSIIFQHEALKRTDIYGKPM